MCNVNNFGIIANNYKRISLQSFTSVLLRLQYQIFSDASGSKELFCQCILTEVESRTQGSRPRPRTQKKSEAKDSLSEDRTSRGQGQGPRTQAQVLSKKQKKRSSQKFFRRSPKKKKKKGLHNNFSSYLHEKTFSKKFFKRFTKF